MEHPSRISRLRPALAAAALALATVAGTAAASERLTFTNTNPDVLNRLAAEGLVGGVQVDRYGHVLGELTLDGNLAAYYAQDGGALQANLFFEEGKDVYRFGGVAECAGLVEISWPHPAYEAQIRSSVADKGRWVTQAVSTSPMPTQHELFAVRGGVNHRLEISWTGGSDQRGKAATFSKTVVQAVGCDQVVQLDIDSIVAAPEGDLFEGEPSPLPQREAGDTLLGQESQSGAAVTSSLVAETCQSDDFNDNNLDGWTFSFIGDADQGGATASGGRVQVTSDGTSFYHAPDNGGFLHRPVTGDFRAQVKLMGFPGNSGSGFKKTSLTVRAGLGPDDPRVTVQFIPNHPTYLTSAIQFDYRDAAGVEHELASTPLGVPLPTYLMIERRGTVFTAYYSTDGSGWIRPLGGAGNGVSIAMPGTLEIGMMNASYAANLTLTAEFDDFKVCSPDVVPLPAVPEHGLCAPGTPIDILYLLDSTGSMTFPFTGGGVSKLDAARQAIAQMNDLIESNLPGSRAALVTFQGGFTPAYNLNSAVKTLAHLTTDFDAVDAAASAIDVGAINPDATTPIAIALNRTYDIFQAEADPTHIPVVIFIGDGWANIDLAGNGPGYYTFNEMSAISMGAYLPPATVAWLGNFNGPLGTYDGQVLADAMEQTLRLKQDIPNFLMFTLGVHSNATFRPDLLGFMALYTGADFFDVTSAEDLVQVLIGIYDGIDCGAEIGDRVWDDANGDGVQDGAEAGLEGVTVELVDGGGDVVATAVTGANGEYLFEAVLPGTYTVRVVPSTLPAGWGTPTYDYDGVGTADVAVVTVASKEVFLEADFGYRHFAGAIGDRVWNDGNGNGIQEGGEGGLAGVTVELRGEGDVVIATAITDANGNYNFTDLGPGSYTVTVVAAGLGATSQPTFDRDGVATPHVAAVELAADQVVTDADFGYREPPPQTGSIGDRVWNDQNGDGVQDGSEPGMPGVTVELRNAASVVIATAVTDAAGLYSFTDVPAGTYTVTVVPAGLGANNIPTYDRDGVITPNVATVVLAAGQNVTDADFGYRGCVAGSIGDRVWADQNGNGVQDPGELGIAGVTVELRNAANVVLATTVTDAAGSYSFGGLSSGTYTVRIVTASLPSGSTQTYDKDGLGSAHKATVTLSCGQNRTDVDFGYKFCVSSIGNKVWDDKNGNGSQGYGEPGLAGVTLELVNGGGTVIATTTTNASGTYTFSNVPQGTYTVRIVTATLPAGYTPTYDRDGIGSAHKATVHLSCCGDVTDVDFGYRTCSSSIGDRVWNDKDGDGNQDASEAGIAGVTVKLYQGGTLIATTTTNSSGNYLFTGIANGNYVVKIDATTLPAGMVPTDDRDGVGSPHQAGVSLNCCGSNVTDADFGYRTPPAFCPREASWWKSHQSDWPVNSLVLGGVAYNKSQLVAFLNYGGNDASKRLARELTATLLNLAAGANVGNIGDEVQEAHDFLDDHAPGTNPQGYSRTRALNLASELAEWNDGDCGNGGGNGGGC